VSEFDKSGLLATGPVSEILMIAKCLPVRRGRKECLKAYVAIELVLLWIVHGANHMVYDNIMNLKASVKRCLRVLACQCNTATCGDQRCSLADHVFPSAMS